MPAAAVNDAHAVIALLLRLADERLEPRFGFVEGETVYLDDVRAEVARELRRTRLRNPPEIGYQLVDHIGPDPETGKVRRVLPLSDGS